jgi:homoserine dehydrogenase
VAGEIGVGLLGLGTVGRGVYRLLEQNAALIAARAGTSVRVRRVLVRDPYKPRGLDLPAGLLTTRAEDVIADPGVQVVVEVMGGVRPALDYVLEALRRGKSVVTANKDMVAEHGRELFAAAERYGCDLFFEASVAGGIPIIRTLKASLAANRIHQIMGIVNGTTNYILTRMSREGVSFQTALAEAQRLGYAEADPAADVEGHDAARKLAILASIAFNSRIPLEEVYVEGIARIAPEDIRYARELGYVIKLLALGKETPEGIEVRVHPVLLPCRHPLAAVNDVFNAVFVRGDAVGETMFYGRGAGELPTASAVVADIIDAARDITRGVAGMIGCTCFENKPVKPMPLVESRYYIRLLVDDRAGVLAAIAKGFGDHRVSLASVIQKNTIGELAEIVLVTHRVAEGSLRAAMAVVEGLPVVKQVANVIRVEGEEE